MPTLPLPAGAPLDVASLRAHRCLLRFAAGEVDVDEPRPSDVFLLELELTDDGSPTVELRVAGVLTRARLAPEQEATVVDRTWWEAHPAALTPDGTALAACRIGGLDFPALPCVVADLSTPTGAGWPVEVMLGRTALTTADWLIDFPAKAWAVTRGRA